MPSCAPDVLQALLQALAIPIPPAPLRSPTDPAAPYSPPRPARALASAQLSRLLPSRTLALLHAAGPRAAAEACAALEGACRYVTTGDVVGRSGAPAAWPRALGALARLFSTPDGRHVLVRLRAPHEGISVLLGALRVVWRPPEGSAEPVPWVVLEEGAECCVDCDCRGFRAGLSGLCMHVLLAAVVALGNVTEVCVVEDAEFATMVSSGHMRGEGGVTAT